MTIGMNANPVVAWCSENLPALGFSQPHFNPLEWRKDTWTININPQTGLCTFHTTDYQMFLRLYRWMMDHRIDPDHARFTTASMEIMFTDAEQFRTICAALPA